MVALYLLFVAHPNTSHWFVFAYTFLHFVLICSVTVMVLLTGFASRKKSDVVTTNSAVSACDVVAAVIAGDGDGSGRRVISSFGSTWAPCLPVLLL